MAKKPTPPTSDELLAQELSALRAEEQVAFDAMMLARAQAIGLIELNISWMNSMLERAYAQLAELKEEMKQDFDKRPLKGIAPTKPVTSPAASLPAAS